MGWEFEDADGHDLDQVHADGARIVDEHRAEDVRQGWRWFVVHHRTGRLYSPIGVVTQPSEGAGFSREWTRAECRPDKAPAHGEGDNIPRRSRTAISYAVGRLKKGEPVENR